MNATATAARREAAAERFKSFIDQAKNEYDLIAIDTNPSATFVTMQVLANANFLVAPITFDAFSLQGIHLVVHHLKETYQWQHRALRALVEETDGVRRVEDKISVGVPWSAGT